jgi:hypothetical protein
MLGEFRGLTAFSHDGHFNEKGAKQATEILVNYLEDQHEAIY